jgi:hypothetical protein
VLVLVFVTLTDVPRPEATLNTAENEQQEPTEKKSHEQAENGQALNGFDTTALRASEKISRLL